MKRISLALLLSFVGLIACSNGEDLELATTKYAATFCTKTDTCNVPRDDPNETTEGCRTRVENAMRQRADGATVSACSKEENDKCRAAIEAQECTAFILETILANKLPAACKDC